MLGLGCGLGARVMLFLQKASRVSEMGVIFVFVAVLHTVYHLASFDLRG